MACARHDLEGRALALDRHPRDPGGAEIVHGHPLARRVVAALVELAPRDVGPVCEDPPARSVVYADQPPYDSKSAGAAIRDAVVAVYRPNAGAIFRCADVLATSLVLAHSAQLRTQRVDVRNRHWAAIGTNCP